MRERLIDAAEACQHAGSGELSAREVMAQAGVSTGTLYHYFTSLDELLLAVAERAAATQPDRFGPPEGGTDPLGMILHQLFHADRRDEVPRFLWTPDRPTVGSAGRMSLNGNYKTEVHAGVQD